MLKNMIKSLRPKQWTKNLLVFAGLVFAHEAFDPGKVKQAIAAFLAFCLVSSAMYLVNDIFDKKNDALHPLKKTRPIASGELNSKVAVVLSTILSFAGIALSFVINQHFGLIVLIYLILTTAYSFYLKRLIILDVMIIASGFMLRVIGGTFAIDALVSSWLIICTTFLALFLVLNKRKAELMAFGDNAPNLRHALKKYSSQFLDQLLTIVTAACLISYALYTLDAGTVAKFETRQLVFTLPFVIYGLFHYLYLVNTQQAGHSPETDIFRNKSLLFTIILYMAFVFFIIYF